MDCDQIHYNGRKILLFSRVIMKRQLIHRGGITSAGYDEDHRFLDIEFDTGRVVRFEGIGRSVAARFLASASPLSFFRDEIEGEYTGHELDHTELTKNNTRKSQDAKKALSELFGG